MFKQYGIELSRQTQSDWMMKYASIQQVLYGRLKAIQLEQAGIHAAETTLKVTGENKHECYMCQKRRLVPR